MHGNFAPRALRPDMELDVRAIPGSTRFVATAAPHHGQAFGSLVMVDPRTDTDRLFNPRPVKADSWCTKKDRHISTGCTSSMPVGSP